MSFNTTFGRTGREVTRVGLGGEGVLRTFGREEEALAVIGESVAQGIGYFDSARVYAGSEGYYGLFWPEHPSQRAGAFQASKSASRDRSGALADLETTLSMMGLDHLDLWQIHDLRTWQDVREVEAPGGALEAFLEAREQGLTRHIGVTGHHDPAVLTHAVQSWDLDSVLLPVNPVEGLLGGFLTSTLPSARERGIAVVGMKVLGAGHYLNPRAGVTPELLVRYALTQEATLVTVGCSNPREVQALARTGREFQPLPEKEEARLLEAFRPYARKLAYYRGVI
ncbi:MAG: aldo/keto reductase [Methanosarcinales archaeon]|nr:aldo/keto reductase [Methanosarcinales archaeon]